jgi:EAL domain-containing protein (putative c-di-GMP-specific phosphodiesterase class I)
MVRELMSSETADWSDPVEHFRQALAEDQFTLYCQPIEALAGPVRYPIAEVLVRLREEEQTLRPPGDFLPVLFFPIMARDVT